MNRGQWPGLPRQFPDLVTCVKKLGMLYQKMEKADPRRGPENGPYFGAALQRNEHGPIRRPIFWTPDWGRKRNQKPPFPFVFDTGCEWFSRPQAKIVWQWARQLPVATRGKRPLTINLDGIAVQAVLTNGRGTMMGNGPNVRSRCSPGRYQSSDTRVFYPPVL